MWGTIDLLTKASSVSVENPRTSFTLEMPTTVMAIHIATIARVKMMSVHLRFLIGPSKSAGAESLSCMPVILINPLDDCLMKRAPMSSLGTAELQTGCSVATL